MIRYIKKEDTKAGMIYDHVEMHYIKDEEVVDILNEKERQLKKFTEECKELKVKYDEIRMDNISLAWRLAEINDREEE